MKESETEFFYGKPVKDAIDCFTSRNNELKEKYKDFLSDNNIEFDGSVILITTGEGTNWQIRNRLIQNRMGQEIEKTFNSCFSNVYS